MSLIDDHIEHVVAADGRERDDRIAALDREARETDALAPQKLVLLSATLVDLACASREDEDRLPFAHQGADVLAGAANHPADATELAPEWHGVVGVLAEPANGESAALPDLGHHERQVQEPVDRVVANQQRAVSR